MLARAQNNGVNVSELFLVNLGLRHCEISPNRKEMNVEMHVLEGEKKFKTQQGNPLQCKTIGCDRKVSKCKKVHSVKG